VAPIPTLTAEEEFALAKEIEARTTALHQGILEIPFTARFVLGRWRETRQAKRASSKLGAVSGGHRKVDAGARVDRTMKRLAALVERRDALAERRVSRSQAARTRIDSEIQCLLLEADLSPALLGEALGALRERLAALSRSKARLPGTPARRALEREIGLPAGSFRARMRGIAKAERVLHVVRNQFVERNLKLVIFATKRFRNLGLSFEDLIQAGNLGLLRAVEMFDHSRGLKFSTYACWWIHQACIRAIQNDSRTIRVPTHLYGRMLRMRTAVAKLSTALGRAPTVKELSRELDLEEPETEKLIEAFKNPLSLDAPNAVGETTIGEGVPDPIPAHPVEAIYQARLQRQLKGMLARLPLRERQVLRWRFGLGGKHNHTLQEIGDRLGLSRERARQLESVAIEKLRKMAEERGLIGESLHEELG
jgi:RNA polymerase primary sigma factor